MSRGYRFVRGLVRWWLALSFRRIRMLGEDKLPAAGPALLVASHPGSFLDALILVAAFDRPVSCLLASKFIRGSWTGWLARHLGMISYEPGEPSGPPSDRSAAAPKLAWQACCDVLACQGVLAVFGEAQQAVRGGEASHGKDGVAQTAAALALEAEARQGGSPAGAELVLLPLGLYVPGERSRSRESLLYLDSPLLPCEHYIPGGDLPGQSKALAALLEKRFRENPFRLQPEDLKIFISELEEVLRVNLEEDWASRPNWKQKVEGFQLSGFVSEWAEQANTLDPARLVALRESLDAWREARRHIALWQSEVELAEASPPGTGSLLRRVGVWCESAAGGILAIYGLINHLPALLILHWTGLLKTQADRDPRREWLSRGAVMVALYTLQVLLLGYWLGRAAAGYYAPTLPLTGLYIWRYRWLLRHRTRPALLALLLPARVRRLRRMRQKFVARLNAALTADEELPEVTKALS